MKKNILLFSIFFFLLNTPIIAQNIGAGTSVNILHHQGYTKIFNPTAIGANLYYSYGKEMKFELYYEKFALNEPTFTIENETLYTSTGLYSFGLNMTYEYIFGYYEKGRICPYIGFGGGMGYYRADQERTSRIERIDNLSSRFNAMVGLKYLITDRVGLDFSYEGYINYLVNYRPSNPIDSEEFFLQSVVNLSAYYMF